jgi:hypothetical protein
MLMAAYMVWGLNVTSTLSTLLFVPHQSPY